MAAGVRWWKRILASLLIVVLVSICGACNIHEPIYHNEVDEADAGDVGSDAGIDANDGDPCDSVSCPIYCRPTTGECVECFDNDDCDEGICHFSTGECVACMVDGDCVDGVCDTEIPECVECIEDAHCEQGLCTPDGECVGCTDDGHCPDGVCDPDEYHCVGCIDDQDCPNGVCDLDEQSCVGCEHDGHCDGGYCHLGVEQCVGCLDDDHCEESVCDTVMGECLGCIDDDDCFNGVCDTMAETCVECLDDDNCEGGVCDLSEEQCVECLDNTDCPDGVCDSDDQCVTCLIDGDCGPDLVCDQTNDQCVECVVDGDCPDILACDTVNNICLGCIDDGDCDGDAKCHDDFPECVDACCDFMAEQVFSLSTFSYERFDIAVTAEGDPLIAVADEDTETVLLAERIGGQWYQQTVGPFEGGTGTRVRLDLDEDGNPHIVVRRYGDWYFFKRQGGLWSKEEVWDGDLGFGYTDIAVDSDGNTHIIGADGLEIRYARYSSQGQWTREIDEFYDDYNLTWLAVDLDENDEPIISLSAFDFDGNWEIHVGRYNGVTWDFEQAVPESTQIHHMSVGPTGEVMVLHRPPTSLPHDGLELSRNGSGGWQTEFVNSEGNAVTGTLDIDSRNDPHIAFHISESGGPNPLAHTRWDGQAWQTESVPTSLVENATRQRIAVDADHRIHIAVYDSANDTITYVTTD